jgi:hypothetical protein
MTSPKRRKSDDFLRLSGLSQTVSSLAPYEPMERMHPSSWLTSASSRASRIGGNQGRRPRPVTRHFYFAGHGQLKTVLSYCDPRPEEPEPEEAIVA